MIAHTKKSGSLRTNYEGIKIGKLTVVQKVPAPSHVKRKGPTYYECKCDCGKIVIVGSSNLTKFITEEKSGKFNKRPHSCGCGAIHLSPGMTVGQVTLLEKVMIHTSNLPTRNGDRYKGAKKPRNKVHYKCKCACGEEKLIQADLLIKNLRHKTSEQTPLSCGCLRRINLTDLLNKQVGKLTILSLAKECPDKPNSSTYHCRCTCGNEMVRGRLQLLYAMKVGNESCCPTCNITRKMSPIGSRIGKLTITGYDLSSGGKYECKCDCGNTTIKSLNAINRWKREFELRSACWASCGCDSMEKKCSKIASVAGIPRSYIRVIKEGAAERKIKYNLAPEYISELYKKQKKKCALTGIPIWLENDPNNPNKDRDRDASLDRINSNLGYVVGNVQWVHKEYNMLKNSWDNVDFIEMCKKVASYHS